MADLHWLLLISLKVCSDHTLESVNSELTVYFNSVA
jgi:hypothetical protein